MVNNRDALACDGELSGFCFEKPGGQIVEDLSAHVGNFHKHFVFAVFHNFEMTIGPTCHAVMYAT